jgi:hypothetical protein
MTQMDEPFDQQERQGGRNSNVHSCIGVHAHILGAGPPWRGSGQLNATIPFVTGPT